MKTKILTTIALGVAFFLISSCNKDKGNYDYHEINEIDFSGIDSVYEVTAGTILIITPKLEATLTDASDEDAFSYEWATVRSESNNYSTENKTVISTDRNLDQVIGMAPGAYALYYTVTDKQTGVFKRKKFALQVTTDIYEGYLVLSDVEGKSRLDMLSYKDGGNTVTHYSDILATVGSDLVLNGSPRKVYCYPYLNSSLRRGTYGIYVFTSENSDRIDPESFGYEITHNLMYDFMSAVKSQVVAENMLGTPGLIPGVSWLYADGYIYSAWRGFVNQLYGNPINAYTTGGNFKVAPFIAANQTSTSPRAILFNEDKKCFVVNISREAYCYDLTRPANSSNLFDFNIGMDLVYMESNYSQVVYAVLRDPSTGKYYLACFNVSGSQSYWGEITGTDIDKAAHFAVSPEWGNLFYSVGGKVYAYNYSLAQSKLMVDKGTSEITFLNFNYFFERTASANYRAWANWLNVGTYDPSKSPDKAGTLEMYSVPPVNGDLVKEKSYDGFGKIVSISYRER